MEGRAFKNDPVDHFSEGASLPRWTVTRRKHRAVPSTRDGTLARSPERSEGSRCKEGMARVFAIRVQILLSIRCVAVQV